MSRTLASILVVATIIAVAGGCGDSSPRPTDATPSVDRPSLTSSGPIRSAAPIASAAPDRPHLPSFAGDEPLLLFNRVTGAGGGIFVSHLDGSGIQELATDVPGVHKRADWSPDGQHVVFIDETTERMYIAHLDGSLTNAVAVCNQPGCDYPSWSPDGSSIAFSRVESAAGIVGPAAVSVNVVDLGTREASTIVKLERPLLADVPRWSPDGTELVFGIDRMDDEAFETGAAIAVVPITGGKSRVLTDYGLFGYAPDWGRATNEIVFATDAAGAQKGFDSGGATWDLWVIHPDGTGLHQLTKVPAGHQLKAPRWTPDGTHVTAYDLAIPGGVIVDAATGSVTPFTTTGDYTRPLIRPLP